MSHNSITLLFSRSRRMLAFWLNKHWIGWEVRERLQNSIAFQSYAKPNWVHLGCRVGLALVKVWGILLSIPGYRAFFVWFLSPPPTFAPPPWDGSQAWIWSTSRSKEKVSSWGRLCLGTRAQRALTHSPKSTKNQLMASQSDSCNHALETKKKWFFLPIREFATMDWLRRRIGINFYGYRGQSSKPPHTYDLSPVALAHLCG